jgi:hypothetical protein
MEERIKKDILLIFNGLLDILKEKEGFDVTQIKELSNHTIHDASIYQDDDSVSVAIFVYALSKILERGSQEFVYKTVYTEIKNAISYLEQNDINGYRKTMRTLFSAITQIDKQIKLYIEDVLDKARLKKGSKVYEHGVSIARAAELLGISQWELMSYVGKTELTEVEGEKVNLNRRLSYARELFQK